MKNIIKYFKNKKKRIKRLKNKMENKNKILQDQADTINFLIKEMNDYKEKTIELSREKKELKKELKKYEKSIDN